MKKMIVLIVTFVIFSNNGFAQQEIPIQLMQPFRLNPITGINGDRYEASSKFVQRMIFSSLTFPLQDPYLQENYFVAMDLSMIEQTIIFGASRNRFSVNKLNDEAGPQASVFGVKLRSNLRFSNSRKDPVRAEDVVYSYRLTRITIDRIYNEKKDSQGINTLMYSKIRNINNVYYDKRTDYIMFELDNPKYCREFICLLAYVPILSLQQILEPGRNHRFNTQEELNSSMPMSNFMYGRIRDTKYNDYDLNNLLENRPGLIRRFYENPVGYGQFRTLKAPSQATGVRGEDLFTEINLERNPDWCNFNNADKVISTSRPIPYRNFSNNKLRIIVSSTRQNSYKSILKNIIPSQILYNFPMTSSFFDSTDELIDKSSVDEKKLAKRKMQISHSLFGIFYGPSVSNRNNPLSDSARSFFSEITDRVRLNIKLLYLARAKQGTEELHGLITLNNLITSDIELQRLYLPFWNAGGDTQISTQYRTQELHDGFFEDYKKEFYEDEEINFRNLYLRASEKRSDGYYYMTEKTNELYDKYLSEFNKYSTEKITNLNRLYNNAKNEFFTNSSFNGIEIVYMDGDEVGQFLAEDFSMILESFFSDKSRVEGWRYNSEMISAKSFSVNENRSNLQNQWENRRNQNQSTRKITLFIYGWNYKFDILEQLEISVVPNDTKQYIQGLYNQLIVGDNSLSAMSRYAEIARGFVDNHVMIPLVGIQNYAVYLDKYILESFKDIDFKDVELMLLPFFWRK